MNQTAYIEKLKIAWVNDTMLIGLVAYFGHLGVDLLSPTLATFLVAVFLGWTLVGGNVFSVVHSLAHQSDYRYHLSRLVEAGHLRHDAHHANPKEHRVVRRAPAMEVVNIGLNTLAVLMVGLWAWWSNLDWLTITLGVAVGVAHWNYAQEQGHLDYHAGVDTQMVQAFTSRIHDYHHDHGLPVTALYPYQFGGWYLVPEGGIFLLAAAIAIPEGLVAWLWPAFDRWLDEQVARHRGEYNAVTATKVTEADAECDPEATQLS